MSKYIILFLGRIQDGNKNLKLNYCSLVGMALTVQK